MGTKRRHVDVLIMEFLLRFYESVSLVPTSFWPVCFYPMNPPLGKSPGWERNLTVTRGDDWIHWELEGFTGTNHQLHSHGKSQQCHTC